MANSFVLSFVMERNFYIDFSFIKVDFDIVFFFFFIFIFNCSFIGHFKNIFISIIIITFFLIYINIYNYYYYSTNQVVFIDIQK